jgi:hypothetical protein
MEKKVAPDSAENPERARPERRRKISVRAQSGGQPGQAVAAARELSPLARLIHALDQGKIRYRVAPKRLSGLLNQFVKN